MLFLILDQEPIACLPNDITESVESHTAKNEGLDLLTVDGSVQKLLLSLFANFSVLQASNTILVSSLVIQVEILPLVGF